MFVNTEIKWSVMRIAKSVMEEPFMSFLDFGFAGSLPRHFLVK